MSQRLCLRIFFYISVLPLISVNNAAVFTHGLLNQVPIGNELLVLPAILVTHTKFLNKIFNFLVPLSYPEMEYTIITFLKNSSDVSKVLGFKGSGTLKALGIYQYRSTEICNILPRIILELDTLNVV